MNQISCEDARLLLSLYIENMLSDEEMTQVREHLAECGSCQSEYALLKGIMEKTKELPELEVSAEFAAKLHSGLEKVAADWVGQEPEQERPAPVRLRRWRVMPAIAAGAAVIALSVFALSRLPGTDQFIQDKTETAAPTGSHALESALPGESSVPAPESATPDAASAAPTEQPKSTQKPEQQGGFFDRLFGHAGSNDSDDESGQAESSGQKTATPDVGDVARTEQPYAGTEPEAARRNPEESPAPPVANAFSSGLSNGNEAALWDTAEKNAPKTSAVLEESVSDATATDGGSASGSGGSGGQAAPAAVSNSKVKVTVTMRFSEEGLAQARAVLADAQTEGGGYVVPSSQQAGYLSKLRALDGFLGENTKRTDYSGEYDRLAAIGGALAENKMQELDYYASHCYIVIQ